MKRVTLAARIRNGKEEDFSLLLKKETSRIFSLLSEEGITNFSLWQVSDLLFAYGEQEEPHIKSTLSVKIGCLMNDFEPFLTWICAPGEQMRLMYEDFGVIRKDKSHIRHRVFVTRLKPGCAEEYKRRHDTLIASRNGLIDPGPDSNFSIWSDGEYVFGYDEIDTTMEHEETDEEHENTVAWETQQLEIMDWITDDVDWLTKEHHPKIVQLLKQL